MQRLTVTLLPPYTFIPGQAPHPVSDPAGHSFGRAAEPVAHFDSADWQTCHPYLYGIDLFNHGFYWEAHEAWESLWHAAGRTGPIAAFLKGLIKLAAAGVKLREGVPDGAKGHAKRAAALFRECESLGDRVMGLRPADLIGWADAAAKVMPLNSRDPLIVFSFHIVPADSPCQT